MKNSFGQNKQKKYSFFTSSNSSVLLLICHSYMSWSTWFISLKLCVGFSISIPSRFHYTWYFYPTDSMHYLTLKRLNSFQNKNNIKATYIFATRPDFQVARRSLKIQWNCLCWSSPKNWPGDELFKLFNFPSFDYVIFSQ